MPRTATTKTATKPAAVAGPQPANHFELQRGARTITYDSAAIDGKPLLNYSDGSVTKSFKGDRLGIVQTRIGTLLTVDLSFIPDASIKTLTVVLPQVNLTDGKKCPFKAVVLDTTILTPLGGPRLATGQIQTSTATTFRGTASLVES
jgi:hypothetical protein